MMVVLGPLSAAMDEVVANWAAADERRAEASGLITYEQVARWLDPGVRAAIEAGLPDRLRRSDDTVLHGTESGFQRHRARREGTGCHACWQAHCAYLAQRKIARNRK